MFAHHAQHSKTLQPSIFPNRNPPNLIRPEEGYHNIDSPLKAAYRLQTSPCRNLSPLRYHNQTDSKINNRKSRSPILFSKRECISPNNFRVSPLRKRQAFQPQQNHGPQKPISFSNLIRRNSNAGNYESQNPSQFNRTMQHSNQNYLQSDRNFREDTNLFKKLANMIKSNKSNESSFMNSGISDNSVKFKGMPQSCKNEHNSNKKMFIKNVMTVESIQSPQERDYGGYNENLENVETKCYQEYERMTQGCGNRERKSSFDCYRERNEPRMEKKDSKKGAGQLREFEALSFKKISHNNDKSPSQTQQPKSTAINYHLTNSFGTATIKKQIIGNSQIQRPATNPFQQITDPEHLEPIESINRSINQSQDSMFASLQMLLSKVNGGKLQQRVEKVQESINVSMGESEASQLDMEPFLVKRK